MISTVNKEELEKIYHFNAWGDKYFGVNELGHICVYPERNTQGPQIDIMDVVTEMIDQGIKFPAVIRFHDILHSQVRKINDIFSEIIEESGYENRYQGVYPIKVNQMREVIEEVLYAGQKYNLGLEAGSKAELLATLAYNEKPDNLTILNGYKDEECLKLALMGRKLGRNVIIVIEKFSELPMTLKLAEEMNVKPYVGLRAKLSVKGSGKWCDSGGETAKFGLSVPEIMKATKLMSENGMTDSIKLLHFHIGSQVTNIHVVKDAVDEAARIYANLQKMGVNIEYFDVGGGLGVDYDASKSKSDSSRNYSTRQYVRDVIYNLKQICELEGVKFPVIVSESGRALSAHHSLVVTKVFDKIEVADPNIPVQEPDEHVLVENLRDTLSELNKDNFQNTYHEVIALKESYLSAFKLGVISLKERAVADSLSMIILKEINDLMKIAEFTPDEMAHVSTSMAPKYLCNFSVFQSLPDTWAIDQLIPIAPLHRLNEIPNVDCTLSDITCDSDGVIDSFISSADPLPTLKLHELDKNDDYFIGFFMTGAYQDVMGDNHNLFGRLNEVHVFCDDDDPTDFYIEEVIYGETCKSVLEGVQYDFPALANSVKKALSKQAQAGNISLRESVRLSDFYERSLQNYTYLS